MILVSPADGGSLPTAASGLNQELAVLALRAALDALAILHGLLFFRCGDAVKLCDCFGKNGPYCVQREGPDSTEANTAPSKVEMGKVVAVAVQDPRLDVEAQVLLLGGHRTECALTTFVGGHPVFHGLGDIGGDIQDDRADPGQRCRAIGFEVPKVFIDGCCCRGNHGEDPFLLSAA